MQQAADEKHKLLMSVVNWGEVYYNTMREVSQEAAEQKAQEIAALPIDIIGVSDDLALAKQAAIFKATHKMSYADCFAAALAKQKNAELITGDPEFKAVEGDVKVWLVAQKLKQRQRRQLRSNLNSKDQVIRSSLMKERFHSLFHRFKNAHSFGGAIATAALWLCLPGIAAATSSIELIGVSTIPHSQAAEMRYRRDPEPELGARVQLFLRNSSSVPWTIAGDQSVRFRGQTANALLANGSWTWHDTPSAWPSNDLLCHLERSPYGRSTAKARIGVWAPVPMLHWKDQVNRFNTFHLRLKRPRCGFLRSPICPPMTASSPTR